MRLVCRAYAFIYETVFSITLIGLALLAMSATVENLRLPLLPWEGATLAYALIAIGILGIVVVLLAATGWFRWALPVWALVVFILMVRGWFTSSYTFASSSGFYLALWITI